MTNREWLSVRDVAQAFGHDEQWVRDQIRAGRSTRSGGTGIPARLVRKVGGSLHIHRSFVYPPELATVENVVVFPAPLPDAQMDEIADRVVGRLLALVAERIGMVPGKDRVA